MVQRYRDRLKSTVTKLPTGYGKTRTATYSFATLRALDMCDVMLVAVPSVGQASQAAEEIPRDLRDLGIRADACVISDNSYLAMRKSREDDKALVFVATIQACVDLSRDGSQTLHAIRYIAERRRIFLVVDEFHHYGTERTWTTQILKVPHEAFLAMSATPTRKGEESPFGPPDVSVTYLDAMHEDAVKRLRLHSYDYRIDMIDRNGEARSFTTADLFARAGASTSEEIDKFMALHEARFSPKFVASLIDKPLERIINLRANDGIKQQMLVFALSCQHAKAVCEHLRELVPDGMSVDWVGTGPFGRTDEENAAILKRFCPPKSPSGEREWTLDILVNVGMAGEGLDVIDGAECVFLHSPRINNRSCQAAGRVARNNRTLNQTEIVGHISVDTASEWAAYVGDKVMEVFDLTEEPIALPPETEREPSGDSDPLTDYQPIPDRPIVTVIDVNLLEIRRGPDFDEVYGNVTSALKEQMMAFNPEIVATMIRGQIERFRAENQKADPISGSYNATDRHAKAASMLDFRVRKVARLAAARVSQCDTPTPSLIGECLKRINYRKKLAFGNRGVKELMEEELEQQNCWVRELEAALMRWDIPPWLIQ